ncbi:hypothetical protein S40293_11480 [Stachybotrys chartarum IBT 40293]|nr:hypothetical protein S40293_11480 [Stachybotrys chartarum IBT 40293]
MCEGLDYVMEMMEKMEWYMALARIALKDNWKSEGDFAILRDQTRSKVVKLYETLNPSEIPLFCGGL